MELQIASNFWFFYRERESFETRLISSRSAHKLKTAMNFQRSTAFELVATPNTRCWLVENGFVTDTDVISVWNDVCMQRHACVSAMFGRRYTLHGRRRIFVCACAPRIAAMCLCASAPIHPLIVLPAPLRTYVSIARICPTIQMAKHWVSFTCSPWNDCNAFRCVLGYQRCP